MGVVWLAEQQKPINRRVALKIIKIGMDSRRVVARFATERQVLARLDHPNFARVYDAGTTDKGRPYFAMEYVHGHGHHRVLRQAQARHQPAHRAFLEGL